MGIALPTNGTARNGGRVKLKFWKWPLASQIMAGLVVGAASGLLARWAITSPEGITTLDWWLVNWIQPLGRLFIRIIFMIVIPLIFAAIVLGVAEMGDLRKLGRVGLKSVLFTLLLSGTSVVIALLVVNVFAPGKRMSEETRTQLTAKYGGEVAQKVEQGTKKTPLAETLLALIPQNPLAEAVNAFAPNYTVGGLIAVMVFSLFFGVALAMAPPETGAPVVAF